MRPNTKAVFDRVAGLADRSKSRTSRRSPKWRTRTAPASSWTTPGRRRCSSRRTPMASTWRSRRARNISPATPTCCSASSPPTRPGSSGCTGPSIRWRSRPGPEDVFLALRGLRTMELRLREAERQGLALARWLQGAARGSARHPPRPARSSGPRALEARLLRLVGPLQHRAEAGVGGRGRGVARRARTVRPRLFLGRLRKPRRPVRLHVLPHRDPLGAGRPDDPLQRRPRGHRGPEGRPRPRASRG